MQKAQNRSSVSSKLDVSIERDTKGIFYVYEEENPSHAKDPFSRQQSGEPSDGNYQSVDELDLEERERQASKMNMMI